MCRCQRGPWLETKATACGWAPFFTSILGKAGMLSRLHDIILTLSTLLSAGWHSVASGVVQAPLRSFTAKGSPRPRCPLTLRPTLSPAPRIPPGLDRFLESRASVEGVPWPPCLPIEPANGLIPCLECSGRWWRNSADLVAPA